jgi:hypothetical protein
MLAMDELPEFDLVSTNHNNDQKTKMLAALAKKQKVIKIGKISNSSIGNKVNTKLNNGKTTKIHRRKSGLA